MAVLERRPLSEMMQGSKRLFCCVLAGDFCVLDSALNAATSNIFPGSQVFHVYDATRAAHIPGIGAFGSGFLSDPKDIVEKLRTTGVRFLMTDALLG